MSVQNECDRSPKHLYPFKKMNKWSEKQLFYHNKYHCKEDILVRLLTYTVTCITQVFNEVFKKQNKTRLSHDNDELGVSQIEVALKTSEPFCSCGQVVWSSSYRVGCGMTHCTNKGVYIYGCHYYRAYVTRDFALHVTSERSKKIHSNAVFWFNRGNFKGWPVYKEGDSCASCPNNCEDRLCSK